MNDNRSNSHSRRAPQSALPGGARVHPMDWAVDAGAVDDLWRETKLKVNRRHRQRRRTRLAATGLVALLIATGFMWRAADRGIEAEGGPVHSGFARSAVVSMPERQILPDGSIVELKSGTAVQVAFTDRLRRVILTGGEAHFQVTRNDQKPFVVHVGGLDVRAVGTAFSVLFDSRQVDVLVTEGTVAVEMADGPATGEPTTEDGADNARLLIESPAMSPVLAVQAPVPLAIVAAGKRVVVELPSAAARSLPPEIVAVSRSELDDRLSWRAPRVEFTKTPLDEALLIINQYSRVRVVLADPALGQVRLSGFLRADNIDTLLRLLEEEHSLKAERRSVDEVVLNRAR